MQTISVVMATYNGERFLAEQLASLAQQTVLPTELVIADDGSSDGTADIVTDFSRTAPFPVRFQRNITNLGYQANFMAASQRCTSALISFCDQDDVWLPDKLRRCQQAFASTETLLVYHNATVTTNQLSPTGDLGKDAAPAASNPPLSMPPWKYSLGFTQVISRSLLDYRQWWSRSADFFDDRKREGHDQWSFFLASTLGHIGYISEPLALYRRHDATITTRAEKANLGSRWSNLLTTSVAGLRSRQVAAARRAAILGELAGSLAEPLRDRAARAAERYRQFESYYRERCAMYTSPHLTTRTRALLGLLAGGAYRSKDRWGLGHEALVRDLFRGLLAPPQPDGPSTP